MVNNSKMQYYLDAFLKLPRKAQEILLEQYLKQDNHILWDLDFDTIKSPIEQIFSIAFEVYCKNQKYKDIYLYPQHKVCCENKKYIVDFAFLADDYLSYYTFGQKLNNTNFKLAIECDGYEFHHKTKEQIKYGNERDFDLKMLGYDILHFSGTQIYENPLRCAKKTYEYIIKNI